MYVANFLSMFKPLHCLHFWCIQLCRSHGRICNVFVMVLTYNIRQLRRYVRCGAHAGFKRFHPFLTSFKAIVIIFYGLCSLLLAIRISLACTLCVEQCLCVCIRYKSVLWAIEIRYLQTIIRVSFLILICFRYPVCKHTKTIAFCAAERKSFNGLVVEFTRRNRWIYAKSIFVLVFTMLIFTQ